MELTASQNDNVVYPQLPENFYVDDPDEETAGETPSCCHGCMCCADKWVADALWLS